MENESVVKSARKRARITALLLAASVILNILFLLYAFVLKAEADEQTRTGIRLKMQVEQLQKVADEARMIAEQERMHSMQALEDAVRSTQRANEVAGEKRK